MGVIRWLNRLFWFALLVLASIAAYILYQRDLAIDRTRAEPTGRFGIVLGSGIDPDGILTWDSRTRLQRGLDLLAEGRVERLILSGGSRIASDPRPTAERMRELAIERGADPKRLVIEDRSMNTAENVIYAMRQAVRLGARPDGGDAIVISDSYHIARSRLIARYLGYPALMAVAADRKRPFGPKRTAQRTIYEVLAIVGNAARFLGWEIHGRPKRLAEDAG